jgi:hypothetical protein
MRRTNDETYAPIIIFTQLPTEAHTNHRSNRITSTSQREMDDSRMGRTA